MSFNQKGNAQFTLQEGASVTENDDGTLTGVAVYIGGDGGGGFAPAIGSPHPFQPRCECTSVEFQSISLGRIKYTASYFGISNDTRRVSYTAGVASEDIQLSPNFQKFAGTPENPKNGAKWDPKTEENGDTYYVFLGFFGGAAGSVDDNLIGVTNFLVPSGTVEVSYYTSRSPKLKRLATIYNKVRGWNKPEGVKNLLLTDMPYRQIGRSHYQVTETYLASDERGWNAQIYDGSQ